MQVVVCMALTLIRGPVHSYVFLCAVFGRILNTACCTKCCGNGGGISNKVRRPRKRLHTSRGVGAMHPPGHQKI